MRKFWLTATILYMTLLGAVSLKPADPHRGAPSLTANVIHNALHVPAYMVLTFVLFFTLRAFGVPRHAVKGRVFFMAMGYGILMEILQGLTPDREPSMLDAGLNLCGILLMLVLLRAITKNKKDVIARSPEGATKQS